MSLLRRNIALRLGDPKGAIALAAKRTSPLTSQYWNAGGTMSIKELAQSCYMQGIDDAFESLRERFPRKHIEPPVLALESVYDQ